MLTKNLFSLTVPERQKSLAIRSSLPFWTAVMVGFLCLGKAEGHPVSVIHENVFVTQEKILVSIEVFLEDLYFFQQLKPDSENNIAHEDIKRAIEKHKQFLLDRLIIRDVNGEWLMESAVSVDDSSLKPDGVQMSDLMSITLEFRFEYSLSEPPEFLTFSQQLVDPTSVVPAVVYFNLKQEGSETPYYFPMKPGEPQTIRFNWEHPPLAPDASEKDWLKWMDERREETLGITSFGTIYSFLYIEDFEVRHEILIPLVTLESFLALPREDADFLSVAEQKASRKAIEAYFADANPIAIDGITVKPVVERLDFFGLDFKDFAKPAEQKRVSAVNARVGIILTYSTKGTPDKVDLTWNMFNDNVWGVESVCFAFDQGRRLDFARYQNENFQWTNPGRKVNLDVSPVEVTLEPRPVWSVSLLSAASLSCCLLFALGLLKEGGRRPRTYIAVSMLLIIGLCCLPFSRMTFASPLQPPPKISNEKAETVFKTLHKNIYRAFDYHTDSEVYDALAKSAEGSFQETLFRQINQSLKMQEQGGAVSRITDVQWESIETDAGATSGTSEVYDERSFAVTSTWNVAGTVEHWGHIHERTNQYQAVFYLEPVDGTWKLTGMNLLDQQRLSFETGVRVVELEEQTSNQTPESTSAKQ